MHIKGHLKTTKATSIFTARHNHCKIVLINHRQSKDKSDDYFIVALLISDII